MQLRARPGQRFAYHHRSMLVTDPTGCIHGAGAEGFYFHSTRLLSRLLWAVDGRTLTPFAVSEVGHDAMLGYAEVPRDPRTKKQQVFDQVSGTHVEIVTFVRDGLRLRLRFNSHLDHARSLTLRLRTATDFASPGEADTGKPAERPVDTLWDEHARTLERRLDDDRLDRAVRIETETGPQPDWVNNQLCFPVHLRPHESTAIDILVVPVFDGMAHRPPPGRFSTESRNSPNRDVAPQLETTNDTVARAWRTAIDDLQSLPLGESDGPGSLIAGVPLYGHFFGRDVLTAGWQALLAQSRPLRDGLKANAHRQGRRIDDWRDEEPGTMIHQAGDAPPAALDENPLACYYGDYATPVDFLTMLGQYYAWTADTRTAFELLPAARRALSWLDRYGDLDGTGLLTYRRRSARGVRNQGWKDAPNAIVDEHGSVQHDPIATCELQGYWYTALRHSALVFAAAGDRVLAVRLLRRAARLRDRINRTLWLHEEGCYALGLGPEGQLLRSVTSNAGHLMLTAVATPDQGRRTAQRLLQPDMFSGWGIRTLSAEHTTFHPFSYHLGSVWPVEQASIAAGFGRYGCYDELHRLACGFFDLAEIFADNRIPESVGGIHRDADHPHPGVYPRANAPQAWSASAVILMIQALLGLRPFAPAHMLLIDPQLPPWLPDLALRGIRIGTAVLDLHVHRTGNGHTTWRAQVRRGHLLVKRRPALRAHKHHTTVP
jgi:glycogen debranching enzyme